MSYPIPDIAVPLLREFITEKTGLYFPESKLNDLERGINSAAAEFGYKEVPEFIRWLLSAQLTRNHIERLASHFTVGETYFFRDKETFRILEEQVIPDIIRSKQDREKTLRVWSAGCCTGEEPYSIAILLSRILPDLKDWNISILGTDINIVYLKKAADGLYTEWSFRDTPKWVEEGYFKKDKRGKLRIANSIKKMVTFGYLNLAEDVYPSLLNSTNALDIIICRNVLMYFSEEKAARVVVGFSKSLVHNGWLVVSPTEPLRMISTQFYHANIPNTTIFRKDRRRPAGATDLSSDSWFYASDPSITGLDIFSGLTFDNGTELSHAGTPSAAVPEEFERRDITGGGKEASSPGDGGAEQAAVKSRSFANQGRLSEASEWAAKAISADPLNPAYRYLHATILQEQNLIDEAVACLQNALYLDSNFALAYFMLGSIMQRRGKKRESIKYFMNAADLLSSYEPDSVVPETEGISAERLIEIIVSMRMQSSNISPNSAGERKIR